MRVLMAATVLALVIGVVSILNPAPVAVSVADGLTGMPTPQYTDDGKLILPTGYREWIYVGASLGLSYSKNDPTGPGLFHHIYIQREAYAHYVETGKFPEKTMLVMENYSAGSKEDNTAKGKVEGEAEFENLHGHFEDKRVGVEVALKDSETYEDGWAYFNFSRRDALAKEVVAFPKVACYDCHKSHAADDNVFVQFYPVLREHYEIRNQK